MMPTYHNLQLVIIDKHDREYDVNDVIAIRCEGLDAIIVKRISAIYPEGYYVLGDNMDNSIDSRDERVGLIKDASVIGKLLN